MMPRAGLTVFVAALALAGCGGGGGDEVTVGPIGPDGEATTMSRDEGLDYLFDEGQIPPQVTLQVCQLIEIRGEDDARELYVKRFSADIDFSGAEIFDEAASRCDG